MPNFRARRENVRKNDFGRFWARLDFLRSQVAIYTVFHEESESEVKKHQIVQWYRVVQEKQINFLQRFLLLGSVFLKQLHTASGFGNV